MHHKLVSPGPPRTFVLVFEKEDEFMEEMRAFAASKDIESAHFTAIGALREAVLAFFVREERDYDEVPVNEQVEVVSLTGNVAIFEEEPKLHVHAVLGYRDGSTVGGHVKKAVVWPTLDVFLTEMAFPIRRVTDEETGLALLELR